MLLRIHETNHRTENSEPISHREDRGQRTEHSGQYYGRPTPDVFKEGGEVVVTGVFDKAGVLQADEVTAKCPSKYEGKEQSEFGDSPTGYPKSK